MNRALDRPRLLDPAGRFYLRDRMRKIACALGVALFVAAGCEKKPNAPDHDQSGGVRETPGGEKPVSAPGEPGAAAAPAGDVILIGEIGSLTGAQATFGISTRNGVELAVN